MSNKSKAQKVLDELMDIARDSSTTVNDRIKKIKDKIKDFNDKKPLGVPLPVGPGFPTTL